MCTLCARCVETIRRQVGSAKFCRLFGHGNERLELLRYIGTVSTCEDHRALGATGLCAQIHSLMLGNSLLDSLTFPTPRAPSSTAFSPSSSLSSEPPPSSPTPIGVQIRPNERAGTSWYARAVF